MAAAMMTDDDAPIARLISSPSVKEPRVRAQVRRHLGPRETKIKKFVRWAMERGHGAVLKRSDIDAALREIVLRTSFTNFTTATCELLRERPERGGGNCYGEEVPVLLLDSSGGYRLHPKYFEYDPQAGAAAAAAAAAEGGAPVSADARMDGRRRK